MTLHFFDPDAAVTVTRRFLPHWFQPGATYFVTFRTADSLPQSVLHRWLGERSAWLRANRIDPDRLDWHDQLRTLPPELQAEFHRTFSAAFHRDLDAGYGECLLRRPEAAGIVAAALRHFDGDRYHLSDFVVMPNHVHVLFGLIGEHALGPVCYSWKKFTAGRINRLFGRTGHFWQGESFDHIVRSPEQFEYLREYIAANPVRAGLAAGEFIHYRAVLDRA
jgi:REP element-mobilizing transposase RayT